MPFTSTPGQNFIDPRQFQAVQISQAALNVFVGSTVHAASLSSFHTFVSGNGTVNTSPLSANVFNTVLNASATTKGEVVWMYGPVQRASGAQSFRITRDGTAPVTMIVSVSVGLRGFLGLGFTNDSATTPFDEMKFGGQLNTGKNALKLTVGAHVPHTITTAKKYGVGLFSFTRSLLYEVASTDNISSTTNNESTSGIFYRSWVGG